MENKEILTSELYEFLQVIEMIPLKTAYAFEDQGEYRHLCFMKIFSAENDPNRYRLMVKHHYWINILSKLENLLAGKVNHKSFSSILSQVLGELTDFPFSENSLTGFAEDISKQIWEKYEAKYTAFVPVKGFRLSNSPQKIPLAKSDLYLKLDQQLMDFLKQSPVFDDSTWTEVFDGHTGYILFEASGDTESIEIQAQQATDDALCVLRFITPWYIKTDGAKPILDNEAHNISVQIGAANQYMVYYNDNFIGYQAKITHGYMTIGDDFYDTALHKGLDDINHHFRNDHNEVSLSITRALKLYDSATRTPDDWQAMYRYVACVEIATARDANKNKLILRLQKLITPENFQGVMFSHEKDEKLYHELGWKRFVERMTEPYHKFYGIRNNILHGKYFDFSPEELGQARVLAHNAIRLIAKVARKNNWQSKDEIEKWFNSQ